jgi:hypothetical protein
MTPTTTRRLLDSQAIVLGTSMALLQAKGIPTASSMQVEYRLCSAADRARRRRADAHDGPQVRALSAVTHGMSRTQFPGRNT